MDQFNDDAWIKAREEEIEQMWTAPLGPVTPAEIPEHELPY